jgi:hypothetical protein
MAYPSVPPQQQHAIDRRAPGNRRASVRYHCGPATVGRVSVAEKDEFLRAWVMDLSVHGMGLVVPRELAIGQLVIITMKDAAGRQTYELPARVAHVSNQQPGEWFVGFELHSPLGPDDLDALL